MSRFYVAGSPYPYQAQCRLYDEIPKWDGFGYDGRESYILVPRAFLEAIGVYELPPAGGRTVLELQIEGRICGHPVGGDTICKEVQDVSLASTGCLRCGATTGEKHSPECESGCL